jgi:hypothetical protein
MRLLLPLVLVMAGTGVFVPSAAAEPLRASVVSASPNDIDEAGVPVSIVFELFEPELPSLRWGKPIGGVKSVAVVLRGDGQTRRFSAEDLGGGRYRTEIVYPAAGAWEVLVSYGTGGYGAGAEVALGKGAICIAADCTGLAPGERAPTAAAGRPWTAIVVGAGILLFTLLLPSRYVVRLLRGSTLRRTANRPQNSTAAAKRRSSSSLWVDSPTA